MSTRVAVQDNEFNPYYGLYINLVPEELPLLNALKEGLEKTQDFFRNLTPEQQNLRYEPGKWSPKEVLLHIIDTERIFSYRALRFGRKDTAALAGFEQDDYVLNGNAAARTMESLVAEYTSVRQATLSLFEHLSKDLLAIAGEASGNMLSPRAAGFIAAGHEIHHINIIKERYL